MRWPVGIAIGLTIVVVVNVLFARMAMQQPPEIVESYTAEQR